MNMTIFWDVTPHSLVDRCTHLPDTYQNIVIFIVIAMRTSHSHVCRVLTPARFLSNKEMNWEILIYKKFSYFRLYINLTK